MEHRIKIIETTNAFGQPRKYSFNLIDAFIGVKLFHEYVSIILQILPDLLSRLPKLAKLRDAVINSDEDTAKIPLTADTIEMIQLIPQIFTWDRLQELAKQLLAGATVEADGSKYSLDENGMGEYANGDPTEVYAAIYHAILANYSPFLSRWTAGGDSTPDTDRPRIIRPVNPSQ